MRSFRALAADRRWILLSLKDYCEIDPQGLWTKYTGVVPAGDCALDSKSGKCGGKCTWKILEPVIDSSGASYECIEVTDQSRIAGMGLRLPEQTCSGGPEPTPTPPSSPTPSQSPTMPLGDEVTETFETSNNPSDSSPVSASDVAVEVELGLPSQQPEVESLYQRKFLQQANPENETR